jgi:hypothetical protein
LLQLPTKLHIKDLTLDSPGTEICDHISTKPHANK